MKTLNGSFVRARLDGRFIGFQLLLAAAIFLCILVSWVPAQASTLGLTEEMSRQMQSHIEEARLRDKQLAATIAAKEAAWQEVELAKSAMRLKINASGSAFYTDRTEQVQGALTTSDIQRDFVARQLVLAARQPIYRKREQLAIEQAVAKFHVLQGLIIKKNFKQIK